MNVINIIRRLTVASLALSGSVVLAFAGEFDSSFNGLGFTRDFIPISSGASALIIHPTGEIVTSGYYSGAAQLYLVLWRHLPDGTLDTSFGGTGIIYPPTPADVQALVAGLAIDNQDRIVLVSATFDQHVVYRFNFDGSPDLSFSGTGSMTIPLGISVFGILGVAIQPDNKIIGVSGSASAQSQFVVYRVQEEGGLDPSFGGTGLIFTEITPGGGTDRATGVAIQPDGNIVVGGRARRPEPGSFFDFALARYSTTGDLDNTFGDGGKVVFSVRDNDYGRRLVLQPDGKIVIAGSVCVGASDSYCYLGVARVDQFGALDPTFGGTGKVDTDVGSAGGLVFDVALQPDNYIVVAGEHQWTAFRNAENAILIRYAPNGALDPRFGLGGISETNYGYVFSEPNTVRLQSDGQIVVCAGSTNGVAASAVTARYLGGSGLSSAEVPSKAAHQTRQDP